MTTTNLPAARPAATVATRTDQPPPATYTLVNPWTVVVKAVGGLAAVVLVGGAVASRIDPDLLPHAAGASVGSLALLLATTGLHSRHSNRARSLSTFRKNPL
jgi:hypothetical protein